MFLSIPQTRLLLVAIGIVAALVLALDLTHLRRHSQTSRQPSASVGIQRNTPGSTAHLRAVYRASLHRVGPAAV